MENLPKAEPPEPGWWPFWKKRCGADFCLTPAPPPQAITTEKNATVSVTRAQEIIPSAVIRGENGADKDMSTASVRPLVAA